VGYLLEKKWQERVPATAIKLFTVDLVLIMGILVEDRVGFRGFIVYRGRVGD
jgi:hypothetical protein